MGDPYWRYRASADTAIPDYIPSDATTLSSRPLGPSSHKHLSRSSDFPQTDILTYWDRSYGVDDIIGIGVRPESGYNSYTSDFEAPYLQRRDILSGSGIPSILNERPESLRKADGGPPGRRESNVLFVDGLPSDCTRREVSHLFRPFLGFKEITVVHKVPRHSADKSMVLCFVEFTDSNYALTALEALQGYKFDNKKPDSAAFRIHFARFPFQLPSDKDSSQRPSDKDSSQRPSDRDPFQLPYVREEQTTPIPRERELAVQDEEATVVMKRKFEGSPNRKFEGSPKRGKIEALENRHEPRNERKWCIFEGCFRCGKQGHLGKDCTAKPRVCYGCGEHGHKHSNCPTTKMDPSRLNKKGNVRGGSRRKGTRQ